MLCTNHRQMAFTGDLGTCTRCHSKTSSGAYKYCVDCAAELSACNRCGEHIDIDEWRQWRKECQESTERKRRDSESESCYSESESCEETDTKIPSDLLAARSKSNGNGSGCGCTLKTALWITGIAAVVYVAFIWA